MLKNCFASSTRLGDLNSILSEPIARRSATIDWNETRLEELNSDKRVTAKRRINLLTYKLQFSKNELLGAHLTMLWTRCTAVKTRHSLQQPFTRCLHRSLYRQLRLMYCCAVPIIYWGLDLSHGNTTHVKLCMDGSYPAQYEGRLKPYTSHWITTEQMDWIQRQQRHVQSAQERRLRGSWHNSDRGS